MEVVRIRFKDTRCESGMPLEGYPLWVRYAPGRVPAVNQVSPWKGHYNFVDCSLFGNKKVLYEKLPNNKSGFCLYTSYWQYKYNICYYFQLERILRKSKHLWLILQGGVFVRNSYFINLDKLISRKILEIYQIPDVKLI